MTEQPMTVGQLYARLKPALYGRQSVVDRKAQARDIHALKALRGKFTAEMVILAVEELRRQVDAGGVSWCRPGERFGVYALLVYKPDAAHAWMTNRLVRDAMQRPAPQPVVSRINEIMRKAAS